jgi:hypothetical protein
VAVEHVGRLLLVELESLPQFRADLAGEQGRQPHFDTE